MTCTDDPLQVYCSREETNVRLDKYQKLLEENITGTENELMNFDDYVYMWTNNEIVLH